MSHISATLSRLHLAGVGSGFVLLRSARSFRVQRVEIGLSCAAHSILFFLALLVVASRVLPRLFRVLALVRHSMAYPWREYTRRLEEAVKFRDRSSYAALLVA